MCMFVYKSVPASSLYFIRFANITVELETNASLGSMNMHYLSVVILKYCSHNLWSLMSPQPPLGLGSRSLNRESPAIETMFGYKCWWFSFNFVSASFTLAIGSQFLDFLCIPLQILKKNIMYQFMHNYTSLKTNMLLSV